MPENTEQALVYLKRIHRLLTAAINEGMQDTVLLFKLLALYEVHPNIEWVNMGIIQEAQEWYRVIGENTEEYEFNWEINP